MVAMALVYLAILPRGTDDNVLRASMDGDNAPEYAFVARFASADDRRSRAIISTLSTYVTTADFRFRLTTGEEGSVPKATPVGEQKVQPGSVALLRTTYLPLKQAMISIAGDPGEGGQGEFTFGGFCWTEADRSVPAESGARLEAKLMAGDERGELRVRFTCSVSGDELKGYTCTYTVENADTKAVSFRWAGFSGTVKPNATFTKTVLPPRLTDERSETAVIDFSGGEGTFRLKTNVWLKP